MKNYFEFYQLPVQFHPDQNQVKQQFYALSKKYHPDFYIAASEAEQAEVLELSSFNNKAFNTLKSEALRLPYVLELLGILVPGENYNLDPDFLMEMMDINEQLMELQFEPNSEAMSQILPKIAQIEGELLAQMEQSTKAYDAGQASSETMQLIKDLYYRNKYLTRIKDQVAKLNS